MCHLLLLMPVLALPVFWLWPLSVAVPLYAAVVVLSGALYVVVMRAMRRSVHTGKESMLHATGRVISQPGEPLAVRIEGERWEARSDEALQPGATVRVIAMEGLTLYVEPFDRKTGFPVEHEERA